MKLAISNIGWHRAENEAVAERMHAHGFAGVELAPGLCFMDPEGATDAEIAAVRAFWETRGISVVALQGLLFGHPELTIFASREHREATRAYLEKIIRLGAGLGAQALVFGAPHNRQRGSLPLEEALPIAVEFFRWLGNIAAAAGTCLCIEPNPSSYGADFIVGAPEALELVQAVGSPGFKLHLDTACAQLAGEDFPERIRKSAGYVRHVHLSEPELAPVRDSEMLRQSASALREINYSRWASIEMRALPPPANNLERVEAALAAVRAAFDAGA